MINCYNILKQMNEKRRRRRNPASLGTTDRSLGERERTAAAVCVCSRPSVTVPLKSPGNAASSKGLKGWDPVCYKRSETCLGNIQSDTVSDDLCTRLVLEALVRLLGQLLRHQNPFLINYQYTIKPKILKDILFFFQKREIKAQKPAKIDFFSP